MQKSSRQKVFCKKGVPKSFAKLTVKHLRQSLFFNKIACLRFATLLTKRLAQMFSCEFCEVSENTFFAKQVRWLLLNTQAYAMVQFLVLLTKCFMVNDYTLKVYFESDNNISQTVRNQLHCKFYLAQPGWDVLMGSAQYAHFH